MTTDGGIAFGRSSPVNKECSHNPVEIGGMLLKSSSSLLKFRIRGRNRRDVGNVFSLSDKHALLSFVVFVML